MCYHEYKEDIIRNFVVKHDYNRASTHKDEKNDYSREWDFKSELDLYGESQEEKLSQEEKENYGNSNRAVKE